MNVQWQRASEIETSKLDVEMGRGGVAENIGLARQAEAKKSDGARFSRPLTPMPPRT